MANPEPQQTLRFLCRHNPAQALAMLLVTLIGTALCIYAATSGVGVGSRGITRLFASDPALFWWSAAMIVGGTSLLALKLVLNALWGGTTIALTEQYIFFSG